MCLKKTNISFSSEEKGGCGSVGRAGCPAIEGWAVPTPALATCHSVLGQDTKPELPATGLAGP